MNTVVSRNHYSPGVRRAPSSTLRHQCLHSLTLVLLLAWQFKPIVGRAEPLGGQVVAGAASIQQNGAALNILAGEDPHLVLGSVGAGLRYSISRNVSARFDYGWQLHDTGLNNRNNSRMHLAITVGF